MEMSQRFHSQNLVSNKSSSHNKLIRIQSQTLGKQNLENRIKILEIYENLKKKTQNVQSQDSMVFKTEQKPNKLDIQKFKQQCFQNKLIKLPRIYKINIIEKRQIGTMQLINKLSIPTQQINIQKQVSKNKIVFNEEIGVKSKNTQVKKQEKKKSHSLIKFILNQQKNKIIPKPLKINQKNSATNPRLMIISERTRTTRTYQKNPEEIILSHFDSPQKIKEKFQQQMEQKQLKSKQIKFPKVLKKLTWKNIKLEFNQLQQKQFLNLMRIYNYCIIGQNHNNGIYKAYVGKGNNSTLIKKCLKSRGYWNIIDDINDKNINFMWTQGKVSQFQQKLPTRNSLCNLQGQTLNYYRYNQKFVKEFLKNRKQDYEYLKNIQCIMSKNIFQKYVSHIISQTIKKKRNKLENQKISEFLYNHNKSIKPFMSITNPLQIRLHNHIESASSIGNKKGLFFYIKKYYQVNGKNPFDIIPQTVHIITNQNKITQQELKFKIFFGLPCILKPGEATNRGQGITIHNNWSSLIEIINKTNKHSNGDQRTHIIQRYIMPFLYHSRKFDIRVWVLRNGKQVWLYKEGYIRTSCKQFNIKSNNKFIHLTNDAIQKYSDEYGRYQTANKISFNQFQKYLESYHPKLNFWESIYPQIKKISYQVFRIGNFTMDTSNKLFSYQLFGLDFMIDENFKVWLIEVNTNPCLQTSCALLNRLITNMIQNVFSIAIDPIFPAPQNWKRKSNWNLENFRFELLYDGYEQQSNNLLKNEIKIFETQEDEFQEKEKAQEKEIK